MLLKLTDHQNFIKRNITAICSVYIYKYAHRALNVSRMSIARENQFFLFHINWLHDTFIKCWESKTQTIKLLWNVFVSFHWIFAPHIQCNWYDLSCNVDNRWHSQFHGNTVRPSFYIHFSHRIDIKKLNVYRCRFFWKFLRFIAFALKSMYQIGDSTF